MQLILPDGTKKDFRAIWMEESDTEVYFIDQRVLPFKIQVLTSGSVNETADFIRTMVIRGAPAIGIAGSYGIIQSAYYAYKSGLNLDKEKFLLHLHSDANTLVAARPTAIDLNNCVQAMLKFVNAFIEQEQILPTVEILKAKANAMSNSIIDECRSLAKVGLQLFKDNINILTHCHTGAFATVDVGSALAPIKLAHEKGFTIHVYVDETRPRLQGGKLTAWELHEAGVPYTVIVDSAAASLMKMGKIDFVLVGADIICSNGDFANKIGTYSLAVLSKYHNIPFFTVAPWSTFRLDILNGDSIPIEVRDTEELTHTYSMQGEKIPMIFPTKQVYNPAFDITPNQYLTGIITSEGILHQPYNQTITKAWKNKYFSPIVSD